eukprot:1160393-Pelagomonas_calceolata.AAC.16
MNEDGFMEVPPGTWGGQTFDWATCNYTDTMQCWPVPHLWLMVRHPQVPVAGAVSPSCTIAR